MTRDEKGTSYDGEEHIKIMKPLFYGITKNMTKHLMKGFELMASQLRGKLATGDNKSSIMERHIRLFISNTFMIG